MEGRFLEDEDVVVEDEGVGEGGAGIAEAMGVKVVSVDCVIRMAGLDDAARSGCVGSTGGPAVTAEMDVIRECE